METADAYKKIQKYLTDTPLLLIGSGNSCANGIPGMPELAQELVRNLDVSYSSDEQWFALRNQLCAGFDLESAMGSVSCSEELLRDITVCTWNYLSGYDFKLFDSIVHREALIPLGELIKFLMSTHPQKLSIITTNYDRVIEYCCDQNDVEVNTFVRGKYLQRIEVDTSHPAKSVNLLKIHGSLDWFEDASGNLCCIPLQRKIPFAMRPKIIAPGATKYRAILQNPYRTILNKMDESIRCAASFLCIGYGFNDEQIQSGLIEEIGNGKPIVVATKVLSDTSRTLITRYAKKYVIIEEASCNSTHIDTDEGDLVVDDELWTVTGLTIKILY